MAQAAAAQRRRFILPLGDCEFAITGVLDELQRDAWPTPADVRPSRSTGAALQVPPIKRHVLLFHTAFLSMEKSRSTWLAHAAEVCDADMQVAAGLTEAAVSGSTGAARIMLFVGGPTTDGPGQVVAKELLEPIRSHKVRVWGRAYERLNDD